MNGCVRLVCALTCALVACTKTADTPSRAITAVAPADARPTADAPSDGRPTAEDRRCAENAECALMDEDCCGCTASGKRVGVRADRVAQVAKAREPLCAATMCALAMSEDPTCAATRAICHAGSCIADLPATPAPGAKPIEIKTETIPPG